MLLNRLEAKGAVRQTEGSQGITRFAPIARRTIPATHWKAKTVAITTLPTTRRPGSPLTDIGGAPPDASTAAPLVTTAEARH